mmetsp:Transcript_29032/g.74640  ORF Transcript_29032/g.74640 Transcript_29032/m.74640 type:complete len:289 (+) Transcript_29032:4440-5306(+)
MEEVPWETVVVALVGGVSTCQTSATLRSPSEPPRHTQYTHSTRPRLGSMQSTHGACRQSLPLLRCSCRRRRPSLRPSPRAPTSTWSSLTPTDVCTAPAEQGAQREAVVRVAHSVAAREAAAMVVQEAAVAAEEETEASSATLRRTNRSRIAWCTHIVSKCSTLQQGQTARSKAAARRALPRGTATNQSQTRCHASQGAAGQCRGRRLQGATPPQALGALVAGATAALVEPTAAAQAEAASSASSHCIAQSHTEICWSSPRTRSTRLSLGKARSMGAVLPLPQQGTTSH